MEDSKDSLNLTAKQLNSRKNSRYCPHCKSVVANSTYYKHSKKYRTESGQWKIEETGPLDEHPSQKRQKLETEVNSHITGCKRKKCFRTGRTVDEIIQNTKGIK